MPRPTLRTLLMGSTLLLLFLCSPVQARWRHKKTQNCYPVQITYQAYYCDGMYKRYLGTYPDPLSARQACRAKCGECKCYIHSDGLDHENELCNVYPPMAQPCSCSPR